jgi:hypothetical protein
MITTTPSYKYTSCVSTELQQNTNNNYVYLLICIVFNREKKQKTKENRHDFVNL